MWRIFVLIVFVAVKVTAQQELTNDDEHLINPEMNIRLFNDKLELPTYFQLKQNNNQELLNDNLIKDDNNWKNDNNNLMDELLQKIRIKLIKQRINNNDEKKMDNIDENELFNNNKRGALALARRSQKIKNIGEGLIPSISVGEFHGTKGLYKFGALTNLQGFFDNLKNNLETMEKKPLQPEQLKFLDGENSSMKKEFINDDYHIKPSGTAAFLHAIRNYRPSQKVRALVSLHPYQGANFHDPNFLWTGLGK